MFENLQSNATFLDLLFLLSLYFLTWTYSLRGQFLIDDHDGVEKYSDRWDAKEQKKIDTYEHEVNGKKLSFRNIQFNPYCGINGSVIRWFRINFSKKFSVIGKNDKGHEIFGFVQSPFRHHLLSLLVHCANTILAYTFLSEVLGHNIARMAVSLFVVHPITCQAVAWISGIGYLTSMFFTLLTFNLVILFPGITSYWASAIGTFLSSTCLLSGIANWVILFAIGKPIEAFLALAVALFMLLNLGKSIVTIRKEAFVKQQMGRSTIIHLRKLIVIVKTFYYYLRMLVFPKRLGLFHKWGYHYDETLERFDGMFFKGILSLLFMGILFYFGPFPIKFGILWLFSYLILFSNVITAQQFVADRYAFIPSLGFTIILAYFLQGYENLYWLILGIYLMRTWVHLPTFHNEIEFYQSNIFNFPDSEVAYGNLGVVWNFSGAPGSAMDCWRKAYSINPFYDVPSYNMYSMFKNSGQLEQAEAHMKNCLNGKTVHFQDIWQKEYEQLKLLISRNKEINEKNKALNQALNEKRYEDFEKIKLEIIELQKKPIQPEQKT